MRVENRLKCCKCGMQAVERSFDGTGWCVVHLLSLVSGWKNFLRQHRGEFLGLSDAFDAWLAEDE